MGKLLAACLALIYLGNLSAVIFPSTVGLAAGMMPGVGMLAFSIAETLGIEDFLKWVIAIEIMLLQGLFFVAVS